MKCLTFLAGNFLDKTIHIMKECAPDGWMEIWAKELSELQKEHESMDNPSTANSLLSGFRVLDLTQGGYLMCGKVLGDLGADVIKIEPPGGCSTRKQGPFYHDDIHPEKSLYWFALNTNKRGITLDIEQTEGQRLFRQLVETVDIVLESFEPGYLKSLGIGYNELCQTKSDIILTSITPFGQTGPYSHYKGADIVGWAMGGMMGLCGDNDRPPLQQSHPQACYHAGVQGAVGSLVALFHKEMAGEGQHVDVSMQQAVILTLMTGVEIGDLYGITPPRPRPDRMLLRPRNEAIGNLMSKALWDCSDGFVAWQHLLAGGAQPGMVHSTGELVKWMEEDGIAGDLGEYDWTEFDSSTISQKEIDHQAGLFEQFFKTKTKRELQDRAVERGIVLGTYQTTEDIVNSAQLKERDFFVNVEHRELDDTLTYPGAFTKVDEAPWQIRHRAPLIGEHNKEVYIEELGISDEFYYTLAEKNII